ncbi:hypothetical protein JQC92_22320 [Shewanella sp. 202IG2-18]|uniref:hypothetical protein n=1 Tax=Parashewanella hymeniacidonis TaxID=2807618 RepID=UPI00195F37EF|nr:hypothetical protein [Parashewanella hymeniacidonis]MBM7074709.1 hypothetical protein [Parashewanella hymeniacidonis]
MQEVSTSVAGAQDVVLPSDYELNQNKPAFGISTYTAFAGNKFVCVPVENIEQESSTRTLFEAMFLYWAEKPSEKSESLTFLDSQQVLFSTIAMQAQLISTLNQKASELATKVSYLILKESEKKAEELASLKRNLKEKIGNHSPA